MRIRIRSWMIAGALVTCLGGCGGAEEECNEARVEAQGVWETYVSALDEAHEQRSRYIEASTQSQLEIVRRENEECRARARDTVAQAAHTPVEEDPPLPDNAGHRGTLAREAVLRVVAGNRPQVRSCYEQELQRHPGLGGRVLISFVVASTGVVESSEVTSSSMDNATVESCLAEAVRGWAFPEPEGNGSVFVRYPFIFRTPRSCPSLEAAEAEARAQVAEGQPELPDQTQARNVLALVTGGANALRDAFEAFRSENSGTLFDGPRSGPAFEGAEAAWQACHDVDP